MAFFSPEKLSLPLQPGEVRSRILAATYRVDVGELLVEIDNAPVKGSRIEFDLSNSYRKLSSRWALTFDPAMILGQPLILRGAMFVDDPSDTITQPVHFTTYRFHTGARVGFVDTGKQQGRTQTNISEHNKKAIKTEHAPLLVSAIFVMFNRAPGDSFPHDLQGTNSFPYSNRGAACVTPALVRALSREQDRYRLVYNRTSGFVSIRDRFYRWGTNSRQLHRAIRVSPFSCGRVII